MGTQFLGLLGLQTPPTCWVYWKSGNVKESKMEKLLADCLETVRQSPLNQWGKAPAAPPLSAQAQARCDPGARSHHPERARAARGEPGA